jgi:hypothetical protein
MTTIPARVFPFVLATPPSGKKPFTPLPIKQNSPQNNFLTPLQQDSVLFTGKKTAASSAARSANVPIALNNKEACRYRELCYKTKRNKQEQQEYDAFAKKIHSARAERNKAAAKRSRKTKLGRIAVIESVTSKENAEKIKYLLQNVLENTFPDVYKPDLSHITSDQKEQWHMTTKLYGKQNWHVNTLLADLGKTLEKKGYTAKSLPTNTQILELLPGLFTRQKMKSFGLDSASRNANGSNSPSNAEEHTSPPEQQQQRASSVEKEKDSSPFPVLPPSETQTSLEERDNMLADELLTQQSRDYLHWGTIPD